MSQTARRLGPQDMFFLYSESSTTMMHVGALMPFTPPSGAPPDLLRQLVDESKASEVVEPWSLRLSHPELLYHPTQSWVVDDNFDLDYHVRRSALASPGDERELGIPVSRLHSHALTYAVRRGKCISSKASKVAGSRSTSRCTTR